MGWLQEHLETFVKPVLGYIPKYPIDRLPFFTPQEMAVIKNMWRTIKCETRRVNKPLLLAGRDVFVFEILARREGFPTTFRPDISRLTAPHIKEDYTDYYLFDTGFAGSIPQLLHIESFNMASSNRNSLHTGGSLYRRSFRAIPLKGETNQIFPRLKGARSLALKIEYTPKYWKRAFCQYEDETHRKSFLWHTAEELAVSNITPKVVGIAQEFTTIAEFYDATLLTMEIYRNNAPRFSTEPLNVIYDRAKYTDWL